MREHQATCVRVIDGDTIVCQVDLDFNLVITLTFRLFGINAPETRGESREDGLASKVALASLIEGKPVKLETANKQDKYGRYLAEVHFEETHVNSWLVKNDLAVFAVYQEEDDYE